MTESYEDAAIRKEIINKANLLGKLLEENLAKDPVVAKEAMEKANNLRNEIETLGFRVTWGITINSKNPSKIDVEVTIWEPRKNMTPEEQKTYDEWYEEVLKRKLRT
ncbi:MAG: hypothetical protein AAB885_00425 [Patescibacteria group bacterium]